MAETREPPLGETREQAPKDASERTAGFRTFLLSDIRGYSSFASSRGDEAAAALTDRFAALADKIVSQFGGVNIGNRGDEVLVAFESPRQAIRAAVAFEQALLEATREDPSLPMPAGVGLDIGEAVVVADGWRANAINVAARLCSIAKGGEILATPEVAHLAQAVNGVRYVARPAVRLKGIPKPVKPIRIVAEAGDTMRGFGDLGLRQAETPVVHKRRGRRALIPVTALAAAVAIAAVLLAGGSSSLPLRAGQIGAIATDSGDVTLALGTGATPTSVAVSRNGVLWVTSTAAGTVSRIDPGTHALTQIPVGSEPAAVTVAFDGSVWVANSGSGTVSRISPENNQVVATVRVGAGPSALAATPSAVWVANTLNGSVTKIALSDDRVLFTAPVGSEPAGITAGGGSIWVANQGDGTVDRLDPATGRPAAAPIKVGNGPINAAFGDGAAWVVNSIDGTLSRLDAQSNSVTTIPVGQGPFDVAVGRGQVWVSDEYGRAVTEVDPARLSIVRTTPTESAPLGLALAGSRVWVATDGLGAAAHRGGILYAEASGLANGPGTGDPDTFDPGSAYTLPLWRVMSITGDGLVGYRRAGGIAGSALVPDLAVSLPLPTDNGLTYTFRIRSGIRYSNGAVVHASDFRSGLERAFKVGGGPVPYFTSLLGGQQCLARPQACDLSRGIVTDDRANTVTFHLSSPDPDLLNQLTLPVAYPVPPGTPVHLPHGGSVPGTGPYEISSYSPAPGDSNAHGRLVLSRNRYFRQWSAAAQPAGFPDQIVVRSNYSPAGQTAAVEQGHDDLAWDSPPTDQLTSLARSYPSQLHESPRAWTNYVWLNVHRPPFDSLQARRAFNYAVDRHALASLAGGAPPGRPTCQLLPPNFPGYVPYCPYTVSPERSGRWLAPDLSKARALVARSGTRGTHVTLMTFPGDPPGPLAKLAATLRSIGYPTRLEPMPNFSSFGPKERRLFSSVEGGTIGWISDYVAASNFFVPIVECGQQSEGVNLGQFCDPSLTARIRKALSDQARQAGFASQEWSAIDRTVVNDAVEVPLSNSLEPDFVARRVGNFEYNPQWGVLVDQLWVR
jgi:YVTN family beta-propeller protein